jgi:hypothetical protein
MTVSMLDDIARLGEALAQSEKQRAWGDKAARTSAARHVIRKLLALRAEGLALYRPLPEGEAFHESNGKWRLAEGSNRSTKSTCGAGELARAACGCDPFDKYPKRNGVALIVGLKQDNIAMIWRKVGCQGAFKIIKDEHTKLWRAVRPDPSDPLHLDPYDLAYRDQWKDAPPLIPPRMIASIAYDDKAKGVPRTVTLTTGWRLEFRPSGSRPDQGDHYNLVWNDEEMENVQWYYEEVRGLTGLDESPKHTPKGIWTATSQVANHEFAELRDKAQKGSDQVKRFEFLIDNNPYVPDEEKRAFFESLPEDERQTRYFGKPALFGRRVYPMYSPMGVHGCDPFDIPDTWARYIVTDPSYQHCATLFIAVDPNEQHTWIYDGFDLSNGDATTWASEVKRRQAGYRFEAAVFDQRMGKQHPAFGGPNVAEQFFAKLQEAEVELRTIGPLYGFFPGSDDVPAREEALRDWMQIRGSGPFSGTPKLQVMRGRSPAELDKQIRMAHYDIKKPGKRAELTDDLLDCLEYAAAFNPTYHEPELIPVKSVEPTAAEMLRAKRHRQAQRGTASSREVVPGLELG